MTPKKLCNDCYWSKDYSKRFEICKENCPSKDKNQIKFYFDKSEFKESLIKCQMSKFKSLASLTQSMINPYFLDIFTKKLKCQFVLPHLNFIYVSDDYTYSNIIKLLKEQHFLNQILKVEVMRNPTCRVFTFLNFIRLKIY